MWRHKNKVGYRGTPMQRFMRKVKVLPNGCWFWLASKDKKGYGRFSIITGKTLTANYAAWLLFRGPLAPDLETDHLCRNHSCVNPDHLEAVTHKVNVLRGNSPCAINARKERCIRGHKLEPPNVYVLKHGPKAGSVHCNICRNLMRRLKKIEYPGQDYFHEMNPNIRAAEERWAIRHGLARGGWRPSGRSHEA
jgi:HNH endonuclease